jgi:hypothetical protein
VSWPSAPVVQTARDVRATLVLSMINPALAPGVSPSADDVRELYSECAAGIHLIAGGDRSASWHRLGRTRRCGGPVSVAGADRAIARLTVCRGEPAEETGCPASWTPRRGATKRPRQTGPAAGQNVPFAKVQGSPCPPRGAAPPRLPSATEGGYALAALRSDRRSPLLVTGEGEPLARLLGAVPHQRFRALGRRRARRGTDVPQRRAPNRCALRRILRSWPVNAPTRLLPPLPGVRVPPPPPRPCRGPTRERAARSLPAHCADAGIDPPGLAP